MSDHDIERFTGGAAGRSRASAWQDLVFTVATADGATLAEQTRNTLAIIDQNLVDAGSARTRLLSVTVYVTNIEDKAQMDDVWCDWIGPASNWPQRACVQAALAGDTLVEITVIAARDAAPSS
ncbi:MAG: enamine deaminase RidA (YjgF/YER057c/UK114 family) [Gammaproteobacteria bacterium]|jgi:enamine deaminase RidA (YjgF/YER057c/UK114 family)